MTGCMFCSLLKCRVEYQLLESKSETVKLQNSVHCLTSLFSSIFHFPSNS
jgi:hypothetical protein